MKLTTVRESRRVRAVAATGTLVDKYTSTENMRTQPLEIFSIKIAKDIRRHDSVIYRRGTTEGRDC